MRFGCCGKPVRPACPALSGIPARRENLVQYRISAPEENPACHRIPVLWKGSARDHIPALGEGFACDCTPVLREGSACDRTPALRESSACDRTPALGEGFACDCTPALGEDFACGCTLAPWKNVVCHRALQSGSLCFAQSFLWGCFPKEPHHFPVPAPFGPGQVQAVPRHCIREWILLPAPGELWALSPGKENPDGFSVRRTMCWAMRKPTPVSYPSDFPF